MRGTETESNRPLLSRTFPFEIETRWLIEKGSLGGRGRERERECTFDWKNSSNQEASHDPEGARFSHVREPERASTRVSVEYRGEKEGAPPLLVSRPVRGALLLVLAPTGPIVPATHYRHYHEFHRFITPLLRRATKMAACILPCD